MPITAPQLPLMGTLAGFRRFTVAEYHWLIEHGFLTENDPIELIEGYLVQKMPRNPPHDSSIQKVTKRVGRLLPAGWDTRGQMAITLATSEPEPDLAVVRGDENTYTTRHPGPADIGLLVEVADSSLPGDRADKLRIYARDCIPSYWIINLIDRQVEVYEQPSGPTSNPDYATRKTYKPGDAIPLVLDGNTVGTIPVAELLP